MPEVSVVIPLYNKAPYIERALRSVLAQTFQDFEIIIIDDGSTDDGAEIVKGILDARIRLIQQKNAGVSAARNRGIAESSFDLIAFLDADDEWKRDFLETVLRLKRNFPEAGAFATAYEIRHRHVKTVPKFRAIPSPPWEGLIPNYFRSALGQNPVCTSAVAIPKKVFDRVGNFPERVPLGEDIDMWVRIALKHPIAFSWRVGAVYHMEATGRSCNAYSLFMEEERIYVKTLRRAIKEKTVDPKLKTDLEEYIAHAQIKAGALCLIHSGKRAVARKLILKSTPRSLLGCLRRYWWLGWTYLPTATSKFAYWLKQEAFR